MSVRLHHGPLGQRPPARSQTNGRRHACWASSTTSPPGLLARVEGYYKGFDDADRRSPRDARRRPRAPRRVRLPGGAGRQRPATPRITTSPTNDGRGQAYGFDVYVARRATSPRHGSPAGSRTPTGVADATAYGRTYPFDYDRRHALSLVGSCSSRAVSSWRDGARRLGLPLHAGARPARGRGQRPRRSRRRRQPHRDRARPRQ